MPERPDPESQPDVLPDALASRVLARAAALDVARDGSPVTDLRAAAAEAGISGRAFDAALAELRGSEDVRAAASAERRRGARIRAMAAGATALLAVGVLAVIWPRLPASGVEAARSVPAADGAATGAPAHVVVHSAGGAPPVTMEVGRDGQLFASLGVAPDAEGRRVGRVSLTGAGGTATTPAALEVSGRAGSVTFRAPAGGRELELAVPGTSVRARGHGIRLVRDRTGGALRAEIVPPAQ